MTLRREGDTYWDEWMGQFATVVDSRPGAVTARAASHEEIKRMLDGQPDDSRPAADQNLIRRAMIDLADLAIEALSYLGDLLSGPDRPPPPLL